MSCDWSTAIAAAASSELTKLWANHRHRRWPSLLEKSGKVTTLESDGLFWDLKHFENG